VTAVPLTLPGDGWVWLSGYQISLATPWIRRRTRYRSRTLTTRAGRGIVAP